MFVKHFIIEIHINLNKIEVSCMVLSCYIELCEQHADQRSWPFSWVIAAFNGSGSRETRGLLEL